MTDDTTKQPVKLVDYLLTTDKAGRKRAYKVNPKTGKKSPIAYKVAQKRKRNLTYTRKKAAEIAFFWEREGEEISKAEGGSKKAGVRVFKKSRKAGYTAKQSRDYARRHTGIGVRYSGFYQFSDPSGTDYKGEKQFFEPFTVGESPGMDEYGSRVEDRPGVGYQSIQMYRHANQYDGLVEMAKQTFKDHVAAHKAGDEKLHLGSYIVVLYDKETGRHIVPCESDTWVLDKGKLPVNSGFEGMDVEDRQPGKPKPKPRKRQPKKKRLGVRG